MTARIHELLDRWLSEAPGRPFIHLPDRSLSYADVGALADALERELRDDGVRRGDRVLVVAENCAEHAALLIACSRVGAWSCGVNARMAPGEVDAFAGKADARVLYFTSGVSPAAAAHAARHGGRPSCVNGLARSAVLAARVEPEPLASDVAAVIFTSGTTGAPKGVMMTHRGVLHFARVSAESRALGPDDRVYAYAPMTHIFGLGTVLLASLHAGAALEMRPQFEPAELFDALAHRRVSQVQGPPMLFSRLLRYCAEHGIVRPDAPCLRYLYAGAGPLDMALKQQVEALFGQPLHHGYGLSEYAGSLHATRLGETRGDTSAGYAFPGAELRIVEPASGRTLPAGARGEIWLRGTGLMPGYFRDLQATADVMRDGGWYASGDLGELHEDGALFIVGRLKEMIIRSGFNVYPAEVEQALNRFPGILNSAVVGHKEADGNEAVVAFVELDAAHPPDEIALRRYLREQLAPYKHPARIIPVDTLPFNSNGKLMRRQLLERL
ncbi:O-succinylbenzoate--CoA ligase [Burkholderia sp. MSh2]|uniref:O-succinylbenzoate-CoA ligase n=1 Tax=Burkholderia paludis TaxID=1506587 RepID=A0A6J5DJW1_9BURK|nr:MULTISPECIES: class I adenylate-forming enzyme family protein [Burkholderia]KEZ04270.1 O-succinylbenzoate--CoA ligase [Burkholderia sp. MSh2]CAB3753521.1 Long-chain-fatty-acid--CoA ligase [Burkholderia paludis]VWB67844.1 O-succinylbenzoate-CoA ligase [Burkholderia paludis]